MAIMILSRLDARDRALFLRWAMVDTASRKTRMFWLTLTHLGGATTTVALRGRSVSRGRRVGARGARRIPHTRPLSHPRAVREAYRRSPAADSRWRLAFAGLSSGSLLVSVGALGRGDVHCVRLRDGVPSDRPRTHSASGPRRAIARRPRRSLPGGRADRTTLRHRHWRHRHRVENDRSARAPIAPLRIQIVLLFHIAHSSPVECVDTR